jgi:hypothetical protein
MCCSDPPPPPDLSGVANASKEVAEIQRQTALDQLKWAKEQDAMNRDILNRVLGVQLPAMEEQARVAREDRQRYETVFRPLEDQFVTEAQEYDTAARRERERASAIADVNQQFDAQRRNALSRIESYGVDPSQTRNAALDIGVRVQQAAAQAGAATAANRRVEDVGRALRSDAINLGRGSLSNVAQSYGGAIGAGQAAVGGANQTTGTSAGAMQGAATYFGGALQGYGQQANILNQGYANQMAHWDAGLGQKAGVLGGVGTLVGAAAGLADGGTVQTDGTDGMVATGLGDGSGIDDTVPIMASDGEYVIPADVVRIKGQEFFDRLVAKYHTPAKEQRRMALV